MKKIKRILAVILCMVLLQVPAATMTAPVTVQAATSCKLKTEKGKLYCYENGKKVCNDWRTVGKYRYYFTKDGCAYKADSSMSSHNVVVKKIDKKYYGFDVKGRMVKGARIAINSSYIPTFYYFSKKTGAYDKTTTAKYRKAAKPYQNAAELKKLLGKPVKTVVNKGTSCFMDGNGKDVQYIYEHFMVNVFRQNGSKKEIIESVMLRY
ncbi:MAG: hypothetical protein PUI16_04060 [Clostridia bacterium]|nr:hypothetical protein [Clostridia bacterium]MDY5553818.1 hypothetical protein [Blautia sp.]